MLGFENLFSQICIACHENSVKMPFCSFCQEYVQMVDPFSNPILGLFRYQGTIRDALLQIKIRQDAISALLLIHFFKQTAIDQNFFSALSNQSIEAVTFVPTHWFKKIRRGFDLPMWIAYILSKELGVPLIPTLKMNGYFSPLSAFSSRFQRAQEVKKRFSCLKNINLIKPQFRKLLLVDDISTSGATLNHCTLLLSERGFDIQSCALAITPLQKS